MKLTVNCFFKFGELMVGRVVAVVWIGDGASVAHHGQKTTCQDPVHVGTDDGAGTISIREFTPERVCPK